jgi:hypothetical protein
MKRLCQGGGIVVNVGSHCSTIGHVKLVDVMIERISPEIEIRHIYTASFSGRKDTFRARHR